MSTPTTQKQKAPLTEAEQDRLLAEAQFDVEKGLQQALDLIDRAREKRRAERLAKFPQGLIDELKRIEGKPAVHRPREEQVARVQALVASSEAAAVEASSHPGYARWKDEELDEFVMVLEEIVASGRPPRHLPWPPTHGPAW